MRLGDVCDVQLGKMLSPRSRTGRASRPYLRNANVQWNRFDLSDVAEMDFDADEVTKFALRSGDLLVCEGGEPGRAAIWDGQIEPCFYQKALHRIRPRSNDVDAKFILYRLWLGALCGEFSESHAQTTIAHLPAVRLKELRMVLPPVAQQRRIVARLDKQIERIERAMLVADEQVAAARVLPSAYLNAIFDGEQAREWPRRRLADVLTLRKDVVHPSDSPSGASTFVGLEHIESLTGRRLDSVEVDMAELTGRKPKFYDGDIVYGYLRPYLNKVWLAEFDGLCSVDQYVFEVDSTKAEPAFVAWFMRSPVYLSRAPITTTPGQLPRIRTEEVLSVETPLPSLAEQRRTLSKLEHELTVANSVAGGLRDQMEALRHLAVASMRFAMSGGLLAAQPSKPLKLPKGIYFKRGAIASYVIQQLHKQPTFGRVQFEKLLYLTECHVGIDLAGSYKREAAGPLDAETLNKLENIAKKERWFTKHARGSEGYFYRPGTSIMGRVSAAKAILGDKQPIMDALIALFAKMNTEQAEVVTTLFAAWNDYLIDGYKPDDSQIIDEVRSNWHLSKERFAPEKLQKSLDWMRRKHVVPTGIGPHTEVTIGG